MQTTKITTRIVVTTAAALKSVLCHIDPVNTPNIAYDKDEYADPLITKIREAIGKKDGSLPASIVFELRNGETELYRQFRGVCKNISENMKRLANEDEFDDL